MSLPLFVHSSLLPPFIDVECLVPFPPFLATALLETKFLHNMEEEKVSALIETAKIFQPHYQTQMRVSLERWHSQQEVH